MASRGIVGEGIPTGAALVVVVLFPFWFVLDFLVVFFFEPDADGGGGGFDLPSPQQFGGPASGNDYGFGS